MLIPGDPRLTLESHQEEDERVNNFRKVSGKGRRFDSVEEESSPPLPPLFVLPLFESFCPYRPYPRFIIQLTDLMNPATSPV